MSAHKSIVADGLPSGSGVCSEPNWWARKGGHRSGWNQDDSGDFADARLFEDLREVSRTYLQRSHARVAERLPAKGTFFLDVASGPVQYEEYREYSRGFEARVCVDLSISALQQARMRLGAHGIFVRGDITRLPFGNNSFDAAVSLHTIYHVPADEQPKAFLEVARVLGANAKAVIVYSWRAPLVDRILGAPILALDIVRKKLSRNKGTVADVLYFAPQTYKWFTAQTWPFQATILSWRSVGVHTLNAWAHGRPGDLALSGLAALEDRYPRFFGRVGRYPLIVITKSP